MVYANNSKDICGADSASANADCTVSYFFDGMVLLFTGQALGGIAFLVIAFIVSPYGLPSLIASLIGRMERHGSRSRRLYFINIMETTKPSPFDYRRNMLLYLSETVPFPDNRNKEYLAAVAREVERLIIAAHGHAAVLFTSYNAMGLVYSMLKARGLPFPLFQMGRRDTAALEKFKASKNGVLFASGALWEGIDIPGDTLSLLIIFKLPFAAPDPIGEYEKGLYSGMDAYKAQALVPDIIRIPLPINRRIVDLRFLARGFDLEDYRA